MKTSTSYVLILTLFLAHSSSSPIMRAHKKNIEKEGFGLSINGAEMKYSEPAF